uniref:Uncharacterized protein n=1 Tax=Octopus bimaculoides TaxID=37653 RepID=A0A0L8HC01_OCTBM
MIPQKEVSTIQIRAQHRPWVPVWQREGPNLPLLLQPTEANVNTLRDYNFLNEPQTSFCQCLCLRLVAG